MPKQQIVNSRPGLSTFITGGPRHNTAPKQGSKTQRRKQELKSYSMDERKNGRNK